MGSHPLNLGVRFILELITLVMAGYWGWQKGGQLKYVWVAVLPIVLMAVWGTFAVPDDPSRSGNAPVPVAGVVRLVIELMVLGLGVYFLRTSLAGVWWWVYGSAIVVHYLVSWDRVLWLLKS